MLWWCRRDLRLDDNPALHAALQRSSSVVSGPLCSILHARCTMLVISCAQCLNASWTLGSAKHKGQQRLGGVSVWPLELRDSYKSFLYCFIYNWAPRGM